MVIRARTRQFMREDGTRNEVYLMDTVEVSKPIER